MSLNADWSTNHFLPSLMGRTFRIASDLDWRAKDSLHASKDQIPVSDNNEFLECREVEWSGMTVVFETVKKDFDTAVELWSDSPDGACQCPHWGYVFKGEVVVRNGNEVERIEAGQAFYLEPGHVVTMTAGTE